jgi:hypothetical protein
MQLSSLVRVLIVGGAVAAAAGSATSTQQQPTGYYPRPQQQQAGAPPAPQAGDPYAQNQTTAPPATSPCEAFCNNVVRCDLGPASDCMQQCRTSNLEQQQNGPAMLADLAQASCERLAQLSQDQAPQPEQQPAPQPEQKPTPQPSTSNSDTSKSADSSNIPAKRTQWVCNATGWWQKCETQGYTCYPQSTMMLGFGSTESAARVSAETECNTAMMRLMSANFAYRTNITTRCRAMSCSAPNSR